MNSQLKKKVEDCTRAAEDFTRLYYATLDNRRHRMCNLYMENATVSWNGNGVQGAETIGRCFEELLSSRHRVSTIDSQPILDEAVGDHLTYIILVSGTVKYVGNSTKNFQQSFMIIAENQKYKIVSDCYRFQEPVPQ